MTRAPTDPAADLPRVGRAAKAEPGGPAVAPTPRAAAGGKTPAGAGIPPHAGEAGAAPAPAGLRGAEWRKAVREAQAGKRRTKPARRPTPALPVPVSGATLTATAHCNGCDWTEGPGTAAAVDRAADKHVSVGHPTATIAELGGAA